MEPGLIVVVSLVGLLGFGLFWFHVLRPMLEAFGILGAGEYTVSSVEYEVSKVYVTPVTPVEADEQTDEQTDVGPSALGLAIQKKQLDVIRALLIDTLIGEGADVALVRSLLKGSNDAIGSEVAASRQRFGITLSERTLMVSDNGQKREIAF